MLRFSRNTRALIQLLAIFAAGVAGARGQQGAANPYVTEEHAVKRVSEHVYVIPSRGRNAVPNVGIIVGNRATLVVDTGMGPQSGEVVVREVQRLSKNPALYLATTHSHPEHISGQQAFPANTVWIMPEAQKQDMDENAVRYIGMFSQRSADMKALLQDVKLREPDIVFEREAKIDLGGVTARLFWLGPAHTRGDTLVLAEEDGVLLPGDIVQSKMFPIMPDSTADPIGWLAILDKLEALHPKLLVPDHGEEVGDASLIGKERDLLHAMQSRTREMKAQGKSAEETVQILSAEFKAKYPDYINPNALSGGIQRFYAVAQ